MSLCIQNEPNKHPFLQFIPTVVKVKSGAGAAKADGSWREGEACRIPACKRAVLHGAFPVLVFYTNKRANIVQTTQKRKPSKHTLEEAYCLKKSLQVAG